MRAMGHRLGETKSRLTFWPPEERQPLSVGSAILGEYRMLNLPADLTSVAAECGSALHTFLGRSLPPCGRSDLASWLLISTVHSLSPSDIKLVAAIGNPETVSLSYSLA